MRKYGASEHLVLRCAEVELNAVRLRATVPQSAPKLVCGRSLGESSAGPSAMGVAHPSAIIIWLPFVLSSDSHFAGCETHASGRHCSRENLTVCIVPPLTSVSITKTPSDKPLCILSRSAKAVRAAAVPTGYSLTRQPPLSRSRAARSRLAAG